MTFDEFIANPYDQNNFLLCVGFVFVGVVLIFLFAFGLFGDWDKHRKLRLPLIIGSALAFIGLVVLGVNLTQANLKIDARNHAIAENNLKKKYNIEGVLWNQSIADYNTENAKWYIKIQDTDSNILTFLYRINPETREPYLLNEEHSDSPVKVNDLLLNKNEK